jgi:hypothetical protein
MKTKTYVIEIRRANGEWYAVVKTLRTSDLYRAKD